jgi:hypothetical protein
LKRDALFRERKVLQFSTKGAGYFVWSVFNVLAIRRLRGSTGARNMLARTKQAKEKRDRK